MCDHNRHPISGPDGDEHDNDEDLDDNYSNYDPLDNPDHDDDDLDDPNLDDDDKHTHNTNHSEMVHDTGLGTATDETAMANDDYVDGNVAPVVQIHPDGLHTVEQNFENHDAADILPEDDSADTEDSALDDIDPADNIDLTVEMDHIYGKQTAPYTLFPHKWHDYSHLHTILESTMMKHYSMKKGIQMLSDADIEAILKELQQLHDRGMLNPADQSTMTLAEKKAALAYLMILKEKWLWMC